MAREDRTEKPTAKHRKRARAKGQIARSPDLGGSFVLVAGLFAISLTGPSIVTAGGTTFREMIAEIANPTKATSMAGLSTLMHDALSTLLGAVGPIAGACMATGLIVGFAQAGRPSPQALKPDFKRINPVSGLKNLLGPNLVFEAVKAVAKVGISPEALGVMMGTRGAEIAQRAAFAYVVIGVIDYAWKRHRHEQQLKMTKQQVKDEARQYGISAEVRSAQRRRQMQLARARMMAAVRTADVVVANPTHFAVALLYDGTRTAPEVVAKGQDLIALQIRRIAEESGVPVITDPPLARALHSSTEIGQVIPEELYAAVARVLAFVYRMAGRRRLAS